jgi:hypothetical protein
MKRSILFVVAAAISLAVVAGTVTASAKAARLSTPYCIDNVTVAVDDQELAAFLDQSIDEEGGALTSAEVVYNQESGDEDGAGESTETVVDQFFDGDDIVVGYDATPGQLSEAADDNVTNVTHHHVSAGACSSAPETPARSANRFGYCSVAGNTTLNGTAIAPGTFLNLVLDQPGSDRHYTGAVPAFYVQGSGITCSLTPAQAALAAASTLKAGGGGDVTKNGFYTYIGKA